MSTDRPTFDVTFRIGGEAGQGVESSGAGFAKALTRGGLHVFALPSYYSRVRGGHNYFTVRASDKPLTAVTDAVSLLLALNEETIRVHVDAIVPGGGLIVDEGVEYDQALVEGRDLNVYSLPLVEIAEKHGSKVMVNTAALAVAATLVGFGLEHILSVVRDNFGKKGEAIVEANRLVAEEAAGAVDAHDAASFAWREPEENAATEAPRRLAIDGNSAFAMGALVAGCKFVAGYPMTPASSVLHYMAGHGAKWGIVVKHADDEIAAVNMVVGAAHVGVRAMAPTSGGGFDLMSEGISLAAMAEVPIVIFLASRPGPATGLATRTAQGDLFLALHAGHGDFCRVIMAPHTPVEAFDCGVRAFNIAEKYQCVVIVLSDQYNATSIWSIDADDIGIDCAKIDRGKLLSAERLESLVSYERYALTTDGISPRALPGSSPKAVYLATGNEHLPNGHISEDPDNATAMADKRLRKLEGARDEIRAPYRYGPDGAETTLLSWGSSFGPIHEAMIRLNKDGPIANMVHFVDLWPFPAGEAREALEGAKRLVDIEGNATAQFASLLYAQTGIEVDQKVLKYDGRGFTAQYILDRIDGGTGQGG